MKHRSTSSPVALVGSRGWLLALALSCVATQAGAQEIDGDYYDGHWTVRLRCADGSACSARVAIKDFAGTWQDVAGKSGSKRVCGGQSKPVTVQSSTHSLLAFTAFGEGLPPPCPTLTVVVKPVDAKTLEGTVDSDAHGAESAEVHARHAAPSQAAGSQAAGAEAQSASASPIRLERR